MTQVTVSPLPPRQVNITVVRGSDAQLAFALTDDAGAPVNLTGESVQFSARDNFAGAVKVPPITNAANGHVDPANGKTTFSVTRAVLSADAAGAQRPVTWMYEVRRIQASGNQIVAAQGTLTIQPTVNPH